MSEVRPFRAVRPAPERAKEVAAPPYDVMTSAEARVMAEGNPWSFLRVDKAEIDIDPAINIYDPLVYETARKNLDNMLAQGVTIQDAKPMYYIYRLTMGDISQSGIVACASIDEYIGGTIKKHELTREEKEQDRIRHVDVCDANTGPIFLAYKASEAMNRAVEAWKAAHAPVYDFVADDGIGHTVWTVDDDAAISEIHEIFNKIDCLYIADGHHRNASAVKVGLKRREAMPGYSPDAEFNYYLSVLFPHDQLYIMDYNRIVKGLNGLTEEEFFAKLGEKFELEEIGAKPYKPERLHTFGMYLSGKWYKLSAKPEIVPGDVVGALDVSVLQNNVLRPLLGIDDPRKSHYIDFVGGMRGLKELSDRVDSGEMRVAFALFPTSMEELMAIADSGEIMPPKSTWFEPKLRSGLFVHKLS